MRRISVFGLGKLGAPLAAVLASKGHKVIGVDVNPQPVRMINEGIAPVQEPQLQALVDAGQERLSATTDVEAAIRMSDATFVIVPTPSTESDAFSNKYVLSAIQDIGRALQKKTEYHLVTVTSTVMPGSTGGEIRKALERCSGQRIGRDIGLCYNPELVALGSVIRDMLYPDMILIGESDRRAGDLLESIYRHICENSPSVQRMNLVNAELTKIAINTFVTTKISFANMLAEVCDRLPEADVDAVTGALGRDSRIGPKYLKGALGYGGPCFPRDNLAFCALARSVSARPDIAEATDRINRYQIHRLAGVVRERLPDGGTVGILGLSYKANTGVTEEAQGVALAKVLADEGFRVNVYDPRALGSAMALLGDSVEAACSAEHCAGQADLLVITTAWPEFAQLPLDSIARTGRRLPIVDCWRQLSADRYGEVADIVYLGRGDVSAAPAGSARVVAAAGS